MKGEAVQQIPPLAALGRDDMVAALGRDDKIEGGVRTSEPALIMND